MFPVVEAVLVADDVDDGSMTICEMVVVGKMMGIDVLETMGPPESVVTGAAEVVSVPTAVLVVVPGIVTTGRPTTPSHPVVNAGNEKE